MRRSAFSLEYNDLVRKYNNQDFSTNNVACGVLLAPAGAALASHMERAAPEASSLKLPHHFWVACTHFYWDPKLAHVKLAQAVALKQKIQEQTVQAPAPVIVCGDLNSTPKSLVYEYLTAPSLQVAAEVRSRCLPELQKAVIAAKSSAESPATPLPTAENKEAEGTAESLFPESPEPILRSVRQGAEPEVTNYTPDFRDTLDYVMVSLDAFAIRQHNTLPGMADLKDHAGLPSADWPSDHLALCCDLVMTKFDNQS